MKAADVALYVAILGEIWPVALAVTTHPSINFLSKPAAGKNLIAGWKLIKPGRMPAVGEISRYSKVGPKPVG